MKECIKLKMRDNNIFYANTTFKIHGRTASVRMIFDTGCSHSMVSASTIFRKGPLSDSNRRAFKKRDLLNSSVEKRISFGVESMSKYNDAETKKMKELVDKLNSGHKLDSKSIDELIEYSNVRFVHEISDMKIEGYEVPGNKVNISYDFDNVALFGMDFINNLYVVIGKRQGRTFLFAKNRCVNGLDILYAEAKSYLDSIIRIDDDEYIDFNSPDKSYLINMVKSHAIISEEHKELMHYNTKLAIGNKETQLAESASYIRNLLKENEA